MSEAGLVLARILPDYLQRMYTHQLPCLHDDHLTKKLLSISFTNSDKDMTRENEQVRNNLAWTKNKNSKSLGQWLAWQIAITNVVDPIYRFELVKISWHLNPKICIKAIIQPKKRRCRRLEKPRLE